MDRFELLFIFLIVICNLNKKASILVDARFFEYELPNRTVTICPTYSLISLECPQIPSSLNVNSWERNLPKYLISIDYIRSYPLRLGYDSNSCQPDLSHSCSNYDLRYINSLCNGKGECSDISSYEIRERSLCAFKAVTEIGFHCVPTLNVNEIQTKYDICLNNSLINNYGFIYSRNYPLKTTRLSCFTRIYAKENHQIILYFVHGELNHDQLNIESITSNGISLLNISLNGNLTTQKLTLSTYEIKITFLPSEIYSYHPTYYLLYFYMIPICSRNYPCLFSSTTTTITTPIITDRMRIQSIGWTRIPNIWILIPIIFAYILILLIIIVLALLLQRRRRKQKKFLEDIQTINLSNHYLDTIGTSSRTQLVTPLSSYNHITSSHQPLTNPSFTQNIEPYYRSSQSDFDIDHKSIPYRIHSTISNRNPRGYNTIDHSSFNSNNNHLLPKSFSDCNLCKRNSINQNKNSNLENRIQPRTSRDKIKERFLTIHQNSNNNIISPHHQIISGQSNGHIIHLPFQYISNENFNKILFKRNLSEQHLSSINNNQQSITSDQNGTTNCTVKFDDDDHDDYLTNHFDTSSHQTNDIQQNFNQHQYFHRQGHNEI